MCGICGFIGQGDLADLRRMNQAMVHRGPDARGEWHEAHNGVYLGHRRLSILDLAGGSQPMEDARGELVVVFNGEIYNHLELRQQLEQQGTVFQTDHSDTEVLLHGYRQWGEALPEKLNGMWAFAIYDRARRKLFLSRDRFGKKPLFYTTQNGVFAFASELRALVQHRRVAANVSLPSLKKYFAYGFIPAPSSFYEGIHKLPGGHNLLLDVDGLRSAVRQYWEFRIEPFDTLPANPEEEWGEQLRELLQRAVGRRLMADVPLGVFLSGGIDSSLITALACKQLGGDRLKTFSIGFEEASFDESAHARRVAELLGTDHHARTLSLEQGRGLAPQVIGMLDEPMGDSSLLPTYMLCRMTRERVTVALSGDGGDELFAGYDPFRVLNAARWYRALVPRPVHRAVRLAAALLPVAHRNMSLDFKVKRTLRGLSYPMQLWNPVWLGPLEPAELEQAFQEPVDLEEVYAEAIAAWDAPGPDNLLDKTLQFYTRLYFQDDILVKADRASMMNSLEVRAPLLDIELVDFVRRIPHQFKYRHGQTKYLLKQAALGLLPHDIVYRAKKGFGIPVGKWMREGSLAPVAGHFPPMLSETFTRRMVEEHRAGRADHRLFLWNLGVVSSFFPQPVAAMNRAA